MLTHNRYLPVFLKNEPHDVPTTNPNLLATAYGMMINELHRSPQGVCASMLKLLTLGLDLDTLTVHSTTVGILYIYFVFALDV